MEKKNLETIAERVKQLRIEAGMSQGELAEKLHFGNRSTVTKFESGERDLTLYALIAYSNIFEVSTDWILKGGDCEAEYILDDTEEMVKLFEAIGSKTMRKLALEQLKALKDAANSRFRAD